MHELKVYLERLKKEQGNAAIAALERPGDPTAFGYGKAVGVFAGLKIAEKLLEEVLEEFDK